MHYATPPPPTRVLLPMYVSAALSASPVLPIAIWSMRTTRKSSLRTWMHA